MWARIINAVLGIWLMASVSVLELTGAAKNNSVICGALCASLAVIAVWEITRGLRWLNLLIGVWLLIAPFVFSFDGGATANSIIVGILMIVLSFVRGNIKQKTGGGWAALFEAGENKTGEEKI